MRERERESREQRQTGRDGEALKSLWVDFHSGKALLSSLLHVCTSKDTDSMLLLFDLTCAVFLIRTTLGSETVLVIGLYCKHHIKALATHFWATRLHGERDVSTIEVNV